MNKCDLSASGELQREILRVSGEGFTEKGRTYKQGAEVERSLLNGESRMESCANMIMKG